MNKVILMSIQHKHLVNILNGYKTLELRKTVSKDYKGWVYIYCTKGIKDILYKYKDKYYTQHYLTFTDSVEVLNSKVVARFWFDTYYKCTFNYEFYEFNCPNDDYKMFLSDLCLTHDEVLTYGKASEYRPDIEPIYAWHIKNLEIFDKPMELREFSTFKRETISCGMDCPPYTDWVEYRVRKAPKNWQYVYKEE